MHAVCRQKLKIRLHQFARRWEKLADATASRVRWVRDPIFVNYGEPLYHLTFDGVLPCETASAVDWHEEDEAMRTSHLADADVSEFAPLSHVALGGAVMTVSCEFVASESAMAGYRRSGRCRAG